MMCQYNRVVYFQMESSAHSLAIFPFGCLKIVQITKFRTQLDSAVNRCNV